MPNGTRDYRDAQTQKYVQPRTLALIKTYYPLHLRMKVLACCYAQLRGRYTHTCRSAYCPACSRPESNKIGKAQYARFESCTPPGRPVRLGHEVYTLPPNLRHFLETKEGFDAWKDAVRSTIWEIHGLNDVGGVMNLHPHGDEDLTIFHPHMDVVLNGYVQAEDGRIREHRPPHIHPDDAREIYIRHLMRCFRLQPEERPEKINLWIDGITKRDARFYTSKKKTFHRVKYSARHVYQPHLAWLNEQGTRGDWYYRPKTHRQLYIFEGNDVISNFTRIDTMLYRRKRRTWFGYMQNRNVRATARRFGRDPDAPIAPPSEQEESG